MTVGFQNISVKILVLALVMINFENSSKLCGTDLYSYAGHCIDCMDTEAKLPAKNCPFDIFPQLCIKNS